MLMVKKVGKWSCYSAIFRIGQTKSNEFECWDVAKMSFSDNFLFKLSIYLSLEWLKNDLNEIWMSKSLSESARYSRDVRLIRGDRAIFPLKWFEMISKSRRDVKFSKHHGKEPPKPLSMMSSSRRFFKWHRPWKKCNTTKILAKFNKKSTWRIICSFLLLSFYLGDGE